MKTNIKKDGCWWSWYETCDRCGKVITDEDCSSTKESNTEEVDFCAHCLKYFLDNNISYSFTKKLYGRKKYNEQNL